MEMFKRFKYMILMSVFVLALAACGNSEESSDETTEETESGTEETTEESPDEANSGTIEIEDAHGTVEVPVNPETVVALDNRTFETLGDFGVELVAAPKDVMPADLGYYVDDEAVENIGNHREPNLEVIAAANPDLVIVGQRFASYYEDIKELVPEATVIDLNVDVSEETETPGENLVNGLKENTTILGQIFDKEAEAEEINANFDQSIEEVKNSYDGESTVMSLIVSGGETGFSAPHFGRVFGPMYEIFDWVPSLEVDSSSTDHQGDDVSVEAIADSNPDWLMVLDRDAAVGSEDSQPAADVIENSAALQNTTAVSEGNIVYAPADTYTNESIQTYTELFTDMAEAFNQ